ncbi:DUF3800 domain-containing protein [Bacillus subtilis]
MSNVRNQPCSCGSGIKYKKCCLEHQNKYTVFCDETGNSGSNYLDLNQPFFVIAGWIVPNKNLKNTSYIEECTTSLGVSNELKSSKLIKRKKARQKFIDLFDSLCINLECIPTFVFAEKKYCVAAKIIETLLDPAYNNEVDYSFTFDNLKKKELTEKVYSFPNESLEDFINFYLDGNAEKMTQCIRQMSDHAYSIGLYEISKLFKGALSGIVNNLETEKAAHASMPNKAMEAINVPVFLSITQIIEKIGRKTKYNFSLVHDETKQFEDAYTDIFKKFSEADSFEAKLTDGNSIIMGYKHLKDFSFISSSQSKWVQAADILAGVLGRLLNDIKDDTLNDDSLLKLAKTLLTSLLFQDVIKLSDSICSNQTREKIFEAIKPLEN